MRWIWLIVGLLILAGDYLFIGINDAYNFGIIATAGVIAIILAFALKKNQYVY